MPRPFATSAAAIVMSGALAAAQTTAPLPRQPVLDSVGSSWTYESEQARFRVEVIATGIRVPWGIAFLPDGRALVTDRPVGRLELMDATTGRLTAVDGMPEVHGQVDGGILDVVLHPDYARNGWIYISYAVHLDSGNTTVVDRARLRGTTLVDRQRLFTARPVVDNSNHFGCRLVLADGYLFISLGERDTRDLAQDLGSHNGKIIRIHDDGRVPRDNPFVGRAGALAEIWSYGHRNPQGLARNPRTGELWEHEHGPKGGDEINIIRRGRNYGWPVITYGEEYTGGPVGAGLTQKEGLEQPVFYYRPSIAPSGMTFYTGDAFPGWRGSVFIGGMAIKHLNRLVVDGARVMHEERLLADRGWRVRSVAQGPDGFLYVGIDGGMIVRIRPTDD